MRWMCSVEILMLAVQDLLLKIYSAPFMPNLLAAGHAPHILAGLFSIFLQTKNPKNKEKNEIISLQICLLFLF